MEQPTLITILIDDDEDDREVFALALESVTPATNHNSANNGIAALNKFQNDIHFTPDVIFLDLNMPRMNGRDCYTELRKIERLKAVPVYIYSTSVDNMHDMPEGDSTGPIFYLTKPTDLEDLAEMLQSVLTDVLETKLIKK